MNPKDSKLQEEIIAAREKGLIVALEFNRVVHTFNKVLKYKGDMVKSHESDLHGLIKSLQENLDKQNFSTRYFRIVDKNNEKFRSDLQHLEDEERTHVVQYERLLGGMEIKDENPKSEKTPAPEAIPAKSEDNGDNFETLSAHKESYLESLNQELDTLEEKLGSIENVRNELEESFNELSPKRAQALEKKEALEDQGEKLINEVGRLESELETTIGEVKKLTEGFVKMVKQVESELELDENIDNILLSSLALAASPETSSANRPLDIGNIKMTNFLKRMNKKLASIGNAGIRQ